MALGIDFGTTSTKIAYRQGTAGIPRPVPIGLHGETEMPSVVAYGRPLVDGGVPKLLAVGEDAADLTNGSDVVVIRDIKRCLLHPPAVPAAEFHYWDPDLGVLTLFDTAAQLSWEDVVIAIVTEALRRASQRLGFASLDDFVLQGLPLSLACPVTANLRARTALKNVVDQVTGLAVSFKQMIEEPALGALPYLHRAVLVGERPVSLFLVYDWGGGTFDTAIVSVERGNPDRITVLAVDGDPQCGGRDIDKALADYLMRRALKEHFGDASDDALAFLSPIECANFLRDVERAKIALSTQERVDVPPVSVLPEMALSGDELRDVIGRSGLFNKTTECVLRAWRKARMLLRFPGESRDGFWLHETEGGVLSHSVLALGDTDLRTHIEGVLFVGGTSQIPFIREALAASWGAENIISGAVVAPIEAVAVGAAWKDDTLGLVVDRYPLSIILDTQHAQNTLYKAFDPTYSYEIAPIVRTKLYEVPLVSSPAPPGIWTLLLVSPDGEVSEPKSIPSYWPNARLIINDFGRIYVKTGAGDIEVPNPCSHPLQRERWQEAEQEEARRVARDRKHLGDELNRPPFVDK